MIRLACLGSATRLALMLVAALGFTRSVWAEDFIVNDAQTTTNGGNAVDGNDTLIVTESGSITTILDDTYGLLSTLGNNSLTNRGVIETQGQSAYGFYGNGSPDTAINNANFIHTLGLNAHALFIYDSDNSVALNSGSILTEGVGSNGIYNFSSENVQITNSGSISTQGFGGRGISNLESNNSTITNSGSISTQGRNGLGISNRFSNSSTITNSGTILTMGDFGYGIYNSSSDSSTITNSGTILTMGDFGYGIYNNTSDSSTIKNSGSIFTQGTDAVGIFNSLSDFSPVTNSGFIQTQGSRAYGILNSGSDYSPVFNLGFIYTQGTNAPGIQNASSDNAPFTNSGSILTEGTNSEGIENDSNTNSAVINTGSVHTKGTDAFAILSAFGTNSPVTNSGYVVSELSSSFSMNDDDGILNLLAPSYIGGAFRFDEPTTVNIMTGPSHSVFWTLDPNMVGGDPMISGTVPWFYDSTTKQFATYDPSVFAGSLDALSDMTGLLSRVGTGRLGETGFWANGFGGKLDHLGDGVVSLDREIGQVGFALGYNAQTGGFDWSAMGGYLVSNLDVASPWTPSHDIDGKGFFAALNTRHSIGQLDIGLGVTGGWIDHDSRRFVNDNLALTGGRTLGESWAEAFYDGWFVSPSVNIGAEITEIHGWTLTADAGLR